VALHRAKSATFYYPHPPPLPLSGSIIHLLRKQQQQPPAPLQQLLQKSKREDTPHSHSHGSSECPRQKLEFPTKHPESEAQILSANPPEWTRTSKWIWNRTTTGSTTTTTTTTTQVSGN